MQVEKCHIWALTNLGQKWMHSVDKSDASSKVSYWELTNLGQKWMHFITKSEASGKVSYWELTRGGPISQKLEFQAAKFFGSTWGHTKEGLLLEFWPQPHNLVPSGLQNLLSKLY